MCLSFSSQRRRTQVLFPAPPQLPRRSGRQSPLSPPARYRCSSSHTCTSEGQRRQTHQRTTAADGAGEREGRPRLPSTIGRYKLENGCHEEGNKLPERPQRADACAYGTGYTPHFVSFFSCVRATANAHTHMHARKHRESAWAHRMCGEPCGCARPRRKKQLCSAAPQRARGAPRCRGKASTRRP